MSLIKKKPTRNQDPKTKNAIACLTDPKIQNSEKLDLGRKNLEIIPAELSKLGSLNWLNLSNNQLTEIPSYFFELSKLVTLKIRSNFLRGFPSEMGKLVLLTSLDLSQNQLEELGDPMGDLVSLTDLSLHSNQISKISPRISNLVNLRFLDISLNRLKTFPEIKTFHCLESLDLSHNRFPEIPKTISYFTALYSLNLIGNKIEFIHEQVICLLNRLRTLDLQENQIRFLPESFGQLGNSLKILRLKGNLLKTLSEGINELTQLEELELSENNIHFLSPTGIGNLAQIHSLSLYNNKLQSLENIDISRLVNLTELGLSDNELETLPVGFEALTALNLLRIEKNSLTDIPSEIFCGFWTLQDLYLNHNALTKLPVTINQMTQLRTIECGSNYITSFPLTYGLKSLVTLILPDNFIYEFPLSICSIPTLQTLNLFGNQLMYIPPEIGQLETLTSLILGYNHIRSLPPELSKLINLKEWYMSGNKLDDFPEQIYKLTNLETLCFSNNNMNQISPKISSLTKLKICLLSANRISKIPTTIGTMSCLTELDLSHNEIPELPQEFGLLTNLTDLDISGNALTAFPDNIINCKNLKQFKVAYNRLKTLPKFEVSDTKKETWISCAGNEWLGEFYSDKYDESKFLTRLEKRTKLYNKNFDKFKKKIPNNTTNTNNFLKEPISPRFISIDSEDELSDQNEENPPISPASMSGSPALSQHLHLDLASPAFQAEEVVERARGIVRRENFRNIIVTESGEVKKKDEELGPTSQDKKVPGIKLDSSGGSGAITPGVITPHAIQTENNKQVSSYFKKTYKYRLKLGWSEMRGRRPNMEDTVTIFNNFRNNPSRILLCCFDGHTGGKSAELAARRLHAILSSKFDEIEKKIEDEKKNHFNPKLFLEELKKLPRDDISEVVEKERHTIQRRRSQSLTNVESTDGKFPDTLKGKSQSQKSADHKTMTKLEKAKEEVKQLAKEVNKLPKIEIKTTPKNQRKERGKSKPKNKEKLLIPYSKTFKMPNSGRKTPTGFLTLKLKEQDYIQLFESTFEDIHQEINKKQLNDGTTALVVLIERDHDRILVANSGDQRAVLARGNSVIQITTDHKPDEEKEKERIYSVGGYVTEQKRVNGILAVSRSLGDTKLHPAVTHKPEVYTVDIISDDKFIIVACDGLWDVVSNEKAVQIVNQFPCPVQAAVTLRDYAHALGSGDNISVIVYRLDEKIRYKDLNLFNSGSSCASPLNSSRGKTIPSGTTVKEDMDEGDNNLVEIEEPDLESFKVRSRSPRPLKYGRKSKTLCPPSGRHHQSPPPSSSSLPISRFPTTGGTTHLSLKKEQSENDNGIAEN